jgi:hypothetical protein
MDLVLEQRVFPGAFGQRTAQPDRRVTEFELIGLKIPVQHDHPRRALRDAEPFGFASQGGLRPELHQRGGDHVRHSLHEFTFGRLEPPLGARVHNQRAIRAPGSRDDDGGAAHNAELAHAKRVPVALIVPCVKEHDGLRRFERLRTGPGVELEGVDALRTLSGAQVAPQPVRRPVMAGGHAQRRAVRLQLEHGAKVGIQRLGGEPHRALEHLRGVRSAQRVQAEIGRAPSAVAAPHRAATWNAARR